MIDPVPVAEVEERQDSRTSSDDAPRRKSSLTRRNRGNLPETLPRIEQVVEPDSLACPCSCGRMLARSGVSIDRGTLADWGEDRSRRDRTVRGTV
mgnify:CR=1 FL=1